MSPEEISEVLGVIKEYLPLLKVLDPLVREAGTAIRPLADSLTDSMVDITDRAIKRYVDKGYTKSEAMELLAINHRTLISSMSNVK